jgi:hypothetical protein
MSFNTNITVGRPPLLWSDVHEAFTKVNENFDILVATIGTGSGLSPIDFTTLDTSLKPTTDNLYDLGDATHRWKSVFTGEYSSADLLNGLWAGSAQIKGVGTSVNLPNGSTVGGDPLTGIGASLIIDPDKTFFKEIQVDNAFSVVATQFADTFNLYSGTGINLTVSSGADSITVANSGIVSVSAGNGISSSTVLGVATITNSGVRSIDNISGLPAGRSQGAGINVSASTGDNVRITNTGVISISSGVGITVSLDAATGDVTVTNSLPAGNTFAQVEVNGDSANRLIADAAADVLNITSGQGITLSKTVANDTLNIAVNPVFDLKGSVFGDDSSLLVDAVDNRVFAGNGFFGNLTGNVSGNLTGNADTATAALTVTLVATNTTAATHFITFVDAATGNENVRTDTNLTYNPSTNTLTAGTFATGALTITGSTIGTTDSSGIIVNELTTFNTDVTFENDINILQSIFVRGSRVILLNDFKTLVAASTNFADFQAKIAALV